MYVVYLHHSVNIIAHYYCMLTCVCVCSQSYPTCFDPMDCSPLGSSVHGIFLARILEWVAISFSRGSSWPRARICIWHWQADFLAPCHLGSPYVNIIYINICQGHGQFSYVKTCFTSHLESPFLQIAGFNLLIFLNFFLF